MRKRKVWVRFPRLLPRKRRKGETQMACNGCSDPYCGDCAAREYLEASRNEPKVQNPENSPPNADVFSPLEQAIMALTIRELAKRDDVIGYSLPVACSNFSPKRISFFLLRRLREFKSRSSRKSSVNKPRNVD